MGRVNRREKLEKLRKLSDERKKNPNVTTITLAHKSAHKSVNSRYSIPCINEGAILEYCYKCNGEIKHVRECEIYERCTRGEVSTKVQACITCENYVADNQISG